MVTSPEIDDMCAWAVDLFSNQSKSHGSRRAGDARLPREADSGADSSRGSQRHAASLTGILGI